VSQVFLNKHVSNSCSDHFYHICFREEEYILESLKKPYGKGMLSPEGRSVRSNCCQSIRTVSGHVSDSMYSLNVSFLSNRDNGEKEENYFYPTKNDKKTFYYCVQ